MRITDHGLQFHITFYFVGISGANWWSNLALKDHGQDVVGIVSSTLLMVIIGKSLQTKRKPQKGHTSFSWRDWREDKPCHGHGGMNYAGPTTLWLRLSNKISTQKWDHPWPLVSIYQLFHHISKAKVYIFHFKVLLKGGKIWPNDHPQGPKSFDQFFGGIQYTPEI